MSDVAISTPDADLVNDANLRVNRGQCVGLVGANGAGKSTLLKVLAGVREADGGSVAIAPRTNVGYLQQTAVSGSDRTVEEEARSRMDAVNEARRALELAEENEDAEALVKAQEAFERADGYEAERRLAKVLDGLGFQREQWSTPCSELSGGWQMRVALARLLLSPAADTTGGLLLLDEPTNHLDAKSKEWLASWIASSGATTVLVSHDEPLLQKACTHIAEVRGRGLHSYTGSFASFLEAREERIRIAAATREKQEAEAAKLEDFIRRFGAKASKASAAQSRQKALDKLRAEMAEADAEAAAAAGAAGDAKRVTLRLPAPPPSASEVLTIAAEAQIGYGSDNVVLRGGKDAVVLQRGMRVIVLGPNGAGKSTFLKSLAGKIPLVAGERVVGDRASIGVFSQDLAQELPMECAALDYVLNEAGAADPKLTPERARSVLGALGMSGTMALRRIGALSGGEKARVALATFVLRPNNTLLLDEPSNHLDATALSALCDGLQDWDGALLAITHNHAFAKAFRPTHVLRVAEGTFALGPLIGELSESDFATKGGPAGAVGPATEQKASAEDKQQAHADRKAGMRAKSKMEKLFAEVESLEAQLAGVDASMAAAGNDLGVLSGLQAERSSLESRVDALLSELESLESAVAAAGV